MSTTSHSEPMKAPAPARRKLAAQPSTVVYSGACPSVRQAFRKTSGAANRPACSSRKAGSNGWLPSRILQASGAPRVKVLWQLKCSSPEVAPLEGPQQAGQVADAACRQPTARQEAVQGGDLGGRGGELAVLRQDQVRGS